VEVWGSSPHEPTIHFVNTDAVLLHLTSTHAKAVGALTPYLLLATSEILDVWACIGPCTTRQSTAGFNGPAKPFSADHDGFVDSILAEVVRSVKAELQNVSKARPVSADIPPPAREGNRRGIRPLSGERR
jgi:hypothetical protein